MKKRKNESGDPRKKLGFNLFRDPKKPNNENRTGIKKKAQLRKEKEDKKKQIMTEKAEKAKTTKPKKKPKCSTGFLDEIEFSTEEMEEDGTMERFEGSGRSLRPRRAASKFISSLEMMIDDGLV